MSDTVTTGRSSEGLSSRSGVTRASVPERAARVLRKSALHDSFQLHESVIPLLGDLFERAARFGDLRGLELPEPLAADLQIAHEAGVCEHLQVLRDGLTRNVGSGSELG